MTACAVEQTGLQRYLQRCGGRDCLVFDDADAASAAAWRLREQQQEVDIRARANRVWLTLIGDEDG